MKTCTCTCMTNMYKQFKFGSLVYFLYTKGTLSVILAQFVVSYSQIHVCIAPNFKTYPGPGEKTIFKFSCQVLRHIGDT